MYKIRIKASVICIRSVLLISYDEFIKQKNKTKTSVKFIEIHFAIEFFLRRAREEQN